VFALDPAADGHPAVPAAAVAAAAVRPLPPPPPAVVGVITNNYLVSRCSLPLLPPSGRCW